MEEENQKKKEKTFEMRWSANFGQERQTEEGAKA